MESITTGLTIHRKVQNCNVMKSFHTTMTILPQFYFIRIMNNLNKYFTLENEDKNHKQNQNFRFEMVIFKTLK